MPFDDHGGLQIIHRLAAIALLIAPKTAATAQTSWSVSGGRIHAAAAGETAGDLRPGRLVELPPGEREVHFPVAGTGKARSLRLRADTGARVVVAAPADGPPRQLEQPLSSDDWTWGTSADGTTVALVRTGPGAPEVGDLRLELGVLAPASGEFGLVVRDSEHGQYRCVWSTGERQLRLDRWLGGERTTVATAAVPAALADATRLALQADGFRFQVWLDDALLLQAFDGALTSGRFGLCRSQSGSRPRRLTLGPPVAARPSAAIVQAGHGAAAARLHGAATVVPGHLIAFELSLDRPGVAVPRSAAGFEPWLLQPRSWWLHGRLLGVPHELQPDGRFACALAWPDLPALRGQSALLRAQLVTADGAAIAEAMPALPLRF